MYKSRCSSYVTGTQAPNPPLVVPGQHQQRRHQTTKQTSEKKTDSFSNTGDAKVAGGKCGANQSINITIL